MQPTTIAVITDEAQVQILHFARAEEQAERDHREARERGDMPAMMAAAIRWEHAANHISN
jgi:hypothetical protein